MKICFKESTNKLGRSSRIFNTPSKIMDECFVKKKIVWNNGSVVYDVKNMIFW